MKTAVQVRSSVFGSRCLLDRVRPRSKTLYFHVLIRLHEDCPRISSILKFLPEPQPLISPKSIKAQSSQALNPRPGTFGRQNKGTT